MPCPQLAAAAAGYSGITVRRDLSLWYLFHRGESQIGPVLHATAIPFDLVGRITEAQQGADDSATGHTTCHYRTTGHLVEISQDFDFTKVSTPGASCIGLIQKGGHLREVLAKSGLTVAFWF